MCYLGHEEDKLEQAKTQYFLHRIFAGPQRKFRVIDNGTRDMISASYGGPLLIVEHKRQIAFSEAQLTSYILRLAATSASDIFYGWRLPALGIIIRGG